MQRTLNARQADMNELYSALAQKLDERETILEDKKQKRHHKQRRKRADRMKKQIEDK